jgi:peptidase E
MATSKKRLLLISNSTLHGGGYLDHAEAAIREFLGARRRVLFVPHALLDRDAYAGQARRRLEKMGYALDSLHEVPDAREAISRAEALFIGGGNTFRLLRALQDLSLLEPIRRRVEEGMPYIGSSAGSVVACPTIRTTNDMPIVEPAGFKRSALSPSRSTPTTSMPTRPRPTWVRPARRDSSSSTRRIPSPSWGCAQGRCSGSKETRSCCKEEGRLGFSAREKTRWKSRRGRALASSS